MTRTNEILEIVSYSIMQHTYLWCGSIRRRSCDDRQWHFEGWPIMKIVVARLGGISNNNRDMHFLHLIHWNRAVCIEKCDPGIMPWRCNYHSIKNFPVSIACAHPPLRMWRRRRRRWSQMQQSCYISTKARSNRCATLLEKTLRDLGIAALNTELVYSTHSYHANQRMHLIHLLSVICTSNSIDHFVHKAWRYLLAQKIVSSIFRTCVVQFKAPKKAIDRAPWKTWFWYRAFSFPFKKKGRKILLLEFK